MEKHLKLREIIWETTPECKNNCEYCGSKEVTHLKTNEEFIKKITDKIAEFPPEEIDISGGDPLLISYETHRYIVDTLKGRNVKCKILINPKSFSLLEYYKILKLYDLIGISLNTKNELKSYLSSQQLIFNDFKDKIVIISNFNMQNIFFFDKIDELVKKNDFTWQIQYTMYKENEESNALYNNEEASKFLFDKVQDSIDDGRKIVCADNINCGICSAGKYSIGITHDGMVIPCLSMRSWSNTIAGIAQGNLDYESLETIWKNNFHQYRFEDYMCCKDICKNPFIYKKKERTFVTIPYHEEKPIKWPNPKGAPITVMYAVTTDPGVYLYGVQPYPLNPKDYSVMAYALFNPVNYASYKIEQENEIK